MAEDSGGHDGVAAVATPTAPVEWRTFVTDDLKADPVVADFVQKTSEKDVPALIKSAAHAQQRLGKALTLPAKDKPDEVKAFTQRLYDAGVLTAPPADPKAYGVTKPAQLPDGMGWNDELAGKFAAVLHKHGAPVALAAELQDLYGEALTSIKPIIQATQEQGLAALKQEHGDKFDQLLEAVQRVTPGIFKSEAELALYEQLGLGNHPLFLGPLMRMAPFFLQDSSFMETVPVQGGQITGEAAREELAKIMNDKTHPMHDGYWKQDPKVSAHIDGLYKKAFGSGKVEIGTGGLSV